MIQLHKLYKAQKLQEETQGIDREPNANTMKDVLGIIKTQYGISLPNISVFEKSGNRKLIKYTTNLLGLPKFGNNILLQELVTVFDLVIECIAEGIDTWKFSVYANIGIKKRRPNLIKLGTVDFEDETVNWTPYNPNNEINQQQ